MQLYFYQYFLIIAILMRALASDKVSQYLSEYDIFPISSHIIVNFICFDIKLFKNNIISQKSIK